MAIQNRAVTCLAAVHPPLPTAAALKYSTVVVIDQDLVMPRGCGYAKTARLACSGAAAPHNLGRAVLPLRRKRLRTPTRGGRRSEAERTRLVVFH